MSGSGAKTSIESKSIAKLGRVASILGGELDSGIIMRNGFVDIGVEPGIAFTEISSSTESSSESSSEFSRGGSATLIGDVGSVLTGWGLLSGEPRLIATGDEVPSHFGSEVGLTELVKACIRSSLVLESVPIGNTGVSDLSDPFIPSFSSDSVNTFSVSIPCRAADRACSACLAG